MFQDYIPQMTAAMEVSSYFQYSSVGEVFHSSVFASIMAQLQVSRFSRVPQRTCID